MPDPATPITDANGEWFELRATADVDLNGLQVGTTALSRILVPASGTCVPLASGGLAVFARSATNNGLPAEVPLVGTFGSSPNSVSLTNGASSFQIGIDGANLDTATWEVTATPGRSFMIDSDGTQCVVPTGVPEYSMGNTGTPGAANSPPECP